MDMFNKMKEVTQRYNNQFRELQKKKNEESSLAFLSGLVEKRMTTSIIGSLDAVEKQWGYLWGINKKANECTSEELAMRDKWAILRKSILDNGNNQKRLVLDEVQQFTVCWNRSAKSIPIYERKNV